MFWKKHETLGTGGGRIWLREMCLCVQLTRGGDLRQYVCICVWWRAHENHSMCVEVWRRLTRELVLFAHPVGSRDQAEAVRLGSRYFLLSEPSCCLVFFSQLFWQLPSWVSLLRHIVSLESFLAVLCNFVAIINGTIINYKCHLWGHMKIQLVPGLFFSSLRLGRSFSSFVNMNPPMGVLVELFFLSVLRPSNCVGFPLFIRFSNVRPHLHSQDNPVQHNELFIC